MSRFAVLVLAGILCGCQPDKTPVAAQPPAKAADPSFVLPGDFSQHTTVAELEARFGKSNVKIVESPGDGDSRQRSIVLFPHDPARRAYVEFYDSEKLIGIAGISVRDAGSRWRGKRGVAVGMSFLELRKVNGKPFYFSGFDSEGRGWIRDQWSPALDDDHGKLGALDVEEGEHMYFGVDLGLRGSAKGLPANVLPVDDSIMSDDPRYPRLGELVAVTAISAYTSLDDEWE